MCALGCTVCMCLLCVSFSCLLVHMYIVYRSAADAIISCSHALGWDYESHKVRTGCHFSVLLFLRAHTRTHTHTHTHTHTYTHTHRPYRAAHFSRLNTERCTSSDVNVVNGDFIWEREEGGRDGVRIRRRTRPKH